jgi:hypothetical protein
VTKAHSDRGKESERLAAAGLRELGFPHAERVVRTGYRVAGRELPDAGDIDGTPGVVWQVKAYTDRRAGRSSTAAAELAVPEWLAQTEAQRRQAGADVGVLIVRRDRALAPRWWAFVDAGVLAGLLIGPRSHLEHPTDIPVRLELADVCTILRAAGYGTPLEVGPVEAAS